MRKNPAELNTEEMLALIQFDYSPHSYADIEYQLSIINRIVKEKNVRIISSEVDKALVETDVSLCCAQIFLQANKFEEADLFMQSAQAYLFAINDSDKKAEMLARSLYIKGVIERQWDKGKEALYHLQTGLVVIDTKKDKVSNILPAFYREIGVTHLKHKHFDKAIEVFKKGLELLEPSSIFYFQLQHYIAYSQGCVAKSLSHFKESLSLLEKTTNKFKNYGEYISYLKNYIHIILNFALFLEKATSEEQAIEEYKKAINELGILIRLFPAISEESGKVWDEMWRINKKIMSLYLDSGKPMEADLFSKAVTDSLTEAKKIYEGLGREDAAEKRQERIQAWEVVNKVGLFKRTSGAAESLPTEVSDSSYVLGL